MSASASQTEEQVLTRETPKAPSLCEECKSNPYKYTCPGCSFHTCSLPCVKAHKARTGCTGKRNQTQFVPLSKFDDNLLLSDYNLLEEVKRVAESAHRMRTKLGIYAYFKLPYPLKILRNAAGRRKTKLMFLPNGMSKREKNQSRYDRRVDENASFYSILEKHLKPGPWHHQLRQFCEVPPDGLKLFIRKYPKGPRSPFKELDMKAPIIQQLANVVILEFPVVFVFLPSHRINFEVIKEVNTRKHKSLQKDIEDNQIPQGVSFREEVIEDDNNSADPHVFDVMKQVESSFSNQVFTQNMSSEKAPNDSSDKSLFEGDSGDNLSHSLMETGELKFPEDMSFDFDPELMKIYADILDETNPNDFFDFDCEFANETENQMDLIDTSELVPLPDELEEGEIAE